MEYFCIATSREHVDVFWFDPWSFMHTFSGAVITICVNMVNFSYKDMFTIFIGIIWEIIENSSIGPRIWVKLGIDYHGDTLVNACADVLFVWLGFKLQDKVMSLSMFKNNVLIMTTIFPGFLFSLFIIYNGLLTE